MGEIVLKPLSLILTYESLGKVCAFKGWKVVLVVTGEFVGSKGGEKLHICVPSIMSLDPSS